MKEASM